MGNRRSKNATLTQMSRLPTEIILHILSLLTHDDLFNTQKVIFRPECQYLLQKAIRQQGILVKLYTSNVWGTQGKARQFRLTCFSECQYPHLLRGSWDDVRWLARPDKTHLCYPANEVASSRYGTLQTRVLTFKGVMSHGESAQTVMVPPARREDVAELRGSKMNFRNSAYHDFPVDGDWARGLVKELGLRESSDEFICWGFVRQVNTRSPETGEDEEAWEWKW